VEEELNAAVSEGYQKYEVEYPSNAYCVKEQLS
jgi:hypothetical protein